MNMEFRRAVTSTAFSLSLSKAQVELLCAYSQGFHSTEMHSEFTTSNALARKGLIASRPFCAIFPGAIRGAVATVRFERYITQAGKLMIELLKEAGLYIPYRLQGSDFISSEFKIGVRA